jgi:hypothetical protein
MTYLMVNLEDTVDCKRAMQQLRAVVNAGDPCGAMAGPGGRRGGPGRHGRGPSGPMGPPKMDSQEPSTVGIDLSDEKAAAIRALPLRAKLERMSQRGVWQHLVGIAQQGDIAKSLAEFDKQLNLQPNKMRSIKAIMAKLENRFGLRFLEVSVDAGNDDAGNPRYMMPHRIRKQILRIATEA